MGKIYEFDKISSNYPRQSKISTKDLFKQKFRGTNQENNKDSCALRISIAFNESGIPIEKIGSVSGEYFWGNDKKLYILRASGMKDYLWLKYGPPVIYTLKRILMAKELSPEAVKMWIKLKSSNGMMVVTRKTGRGSGHVDILYKGMLFSGGALEKNWAHEVLFWEGI